MMSSLYAQNRLVAVGGTDSGDCSGSACATINYAISQASAGDVIEVAAGTYTETVAISKSVTLQGANVGIDPNTGIRTAETRLEDGSITLSGTNTIVIDGFEIYQTNDLLDVVLMGGPTTATLQNTIINREGINPGTNARAITTSAGTGVKTISNNLFTGDVSGGLFSGHLTWNSGMYVNGGGSTVAINDNVFENCRTALNIDDMNPGITLEGNTIGDSGTLISFGGTSPTTGSFTVGANNYSPGGTFINLSNVDPNFRLDITAGSVDGTAFTAIPLADLFSIEATMFHRTRSGRDGLVYYVAGNQYVSSVVNSNIQTAIDYAASNDVINIQDGTYNQRLVVSQSLTLDGQSKAGTVLDGMGLSGTGSGITVANNVTDVTIQDLTVQNYSGSGANTSAGIYAPANNDNLTISNVALQDNTSAAGFYANGPIDNVSITNSMVANHGPGARGIVIWNGMKTNIAITGNMVTNNNCCGIELQDGAASAVNISNNTIDIGSGDNAIGLTGLDESVGANTINTNIITGGGRYGVEVKNPAGGVTVNGNNISLTTQNTNFKDRGGIVVMRRGVLSPPNIVNADVPNGVTVTNNIVNGYVQSNAGSNSEGFGIVVEGTNHIVTGNTVENCDVGIIQQQNPSNYPGNANDADVADQFFGRGNSPITCSNTISGNTFSGNGVDERNVGVSSGSVTNMDTGETFCSIQAAIDDADTDDGDVIVVAAGTYPENVVITKELDIRGPNFGINPNTGIRVAEAIIVPAAIETDVIRVQASNVTIDGITIDGDNSELTSTWIGTNGADIDGEIAVYVDVANINNLIVSNNIIENVSYFGVFMFGAAASDANTSKTGNEITNNLIRDLGLYESGGLNNWGGGMYLGNSHYTNVTNNVITNVRIGIQTGNFQTTHVGAAQYEVIDGNTIETRYLGIFYNLHRFSPLTISNNTITGIDNATQAGLTTRPWRGILLGSLGNNMGASTISDNTIDGSGITLFTTGKEGINVWNVKDDAIANITGGNITGVETGIFLNNFEGFNSNGGDGAHATISGVDITASEIGIRLLDSPSSTTNAAVVATINNNFITGGVDGVKLEETAASTVTGTINNNSITGQSGNTINATTIANPVDATCNWHGTAVFADITANVSGSVDFVPYLIDATDDDAGTAGFQPVAGSCVDGPVRVYSDAGLTTLVNGYTTIQAAIDDATTLDGYFVQVDAGTYDEAISIDKSLTILGPNESESPNTGTRVAEAILAPTGANVQAITGSAPNKTIVIKGITIDMSGATDNARFATQISQDGTIWTFEHNIFTNSAGAVNGDIYFSGNQAVTFNLLDNLIKDGSISNGFSFWSTQPHTFTITDNVWEDNQAWALNLNRATGIIADNIIRNTSVTGPDWFNDQLGIIVATDGNDLTITRNRFENIPHTALNIYQNFDGTLDVINNEFIDIGQNRVDNTVGTAAIRFRESGGTFGNLAGISVSENTFLNNVTTVDNNSGQTLLAECNYWGTTDVGTIDAGIIGGNVDYILFLINGTDDEPATPGFQPAPLACTGGCPGGVAVVNNDTGESFCGIQAAIDAVTTLDGHTLEVVSGSYVENVTVNKELTINGPNAGVACGSRGAEAIVSPATTGGIPFTVTADNVTINGFEITAPDSRFGVNFGNTSNVSIEFNNIHDLGTTFTGGNVHAVIYTVANATTTTNASITDNCFENISSAGLTGFSASAIGILQSTSTGVLDGLSIERNTINNVAVNTGDWPTGKIAYGIQINVGGGGGYLSTDGEVLNAVISNNEISNLSGFISTGIGLEGNTKDAVVENNLVSDLFGRKFSGNRAGGAYDLSGLKFENNRYVSTVTVQDNSFRVTTFTHDATPGLGYAVSNYVPAGTAFTGGGGGTTGEATISCNWLGSNINGDLVDNTSFTGKIFNKAGAVTNFVPFLVNDTDDDAGMVGFQPAPLSCIGGPVQVFNGNTFIAVYTEIQAAIDDATTLSGHTVRIAAGTYVENVDAVTGGKDLIFAPGASPGCVTISGDFTLNAGDALEIEIEGTTACTEHDQFIVTGTVDLGGASLITPLGMYLAEAGDEIVVIDGSSAITNTFVEGNFVTDGTNNYYIDYMAGTDGFDVVLSKCCDGLLDLGIDNFVASTPAGNKLQVFVQPNADVINGAYSAGVFTLRTLTSNMVTFTKLGGALSPFDYNLVTTFTDGGFTYYSFSYAGLGNSLNVNWPAGSENLLLTLSYDCSVSDAEIELVNDAATMANNGTYYQELGAAEAQGGFYQPMVTSPTSVSITADNAGAVCDGVDIDLNSMTFDGTAPYTYAWSGPDGYSSTLADPVPFSSTLASNGTYTVTVTDANGCTAMATTDVTVLDNAACVHNVTQNDYYPTITEAIDAPQTFDDDVLFVPAADWPENVVVTKALTINGANASIACDDAGRVAESVVLGTTVVTIASNGVTIDGFTLEGITGITSTGFNDVRLVNNKINVKESGIEASAITTASGSDYIVENNCIVFCEQVYDTEGFNANPTLATTQTPGEWYTDRFAPAGFVAESFDGDSRLKHSIDASDCSSCRGGGLSGGFYDTQGRKYDISGATAMTIELYVPNDWATTGRRMAGFWGTSVDAGDNITGFPIIEFTSTDGNPRFRGWNNGVWVDLGLPTGFTYDSWYTLEIALLPSDEFMYSVGDISVAVPGLGSSDIDNVILQGHNTDTPGVTYDIYWDNFNTFCAPVANNAPTVGISVTAAAGSEAVVLENNDVTDGFYGYVMGGVNTTARTTVRGGEYTDIMQGVAVVNAFDGVFAPSTIGVADLAMTSFSGDYPALSAINFHSGVYTFTGGPDAAAVIDIAVNNVTVSNTGKPQQNSAGIHFADFSTGSAPRLTATVDNSIISDNANRGVQIRGANAAAIVSNNDILGNGFDPFGAGGNNGFGVYAGVGSQIELYNNNIVNPASQAGAFPVTAIFNGVAPASTIIANQNLIDDNGNGDVTRNSYAISFFDATCNWWGSADVDDIDALVEGNVFFLPYLNDGTDDQPATVGFQTSADCVNPTDWYVNDDALTDDVFTQGVGDDTNPGTKRRPFRTIGQAVMTVENTTTPPGADNNTIFVDAGAYDEQVVVPNTVNGLTLQGVGPCDAVAPALTTTLDFTGTVTGKPTLLDIAGDGTVIDGIQFNVDLTRLHSAIIASDPGLDNITVQNNCIDPYQSTSGTNLGGYGNRNAISINYGGNTNFRVASGGVDNILVDNNRVTATVNGSGLGDDAGDIGFRSAVSVDEGAGTYTRNVFQTINHDVLVRFNSNGDVVIGGSAADANTFNGGGVQYADPNAAGGAVTISHNAFDGSVSGSVLRLQNNYHDAAVTVSDNTLANVRWGMSLENFSNVTVADNTLSPLAGFTDFRLITVNTKSISSNSAAIVQVQINGTFTGNTFNSNGDGTGTAMAFYNHDSDDADLGFFTVGTAGSPNVFAPDFLYAVYLGDQLGSTLAATGDFPEYNLGTGSDTEMACWDRDIDVQNNTFDIGAGAQLPATMNNAERAALEVILYHLPDNACLGELIYFDPVLVEAKVFLQGAFDSVAGLMRDDLRSAGLVPATEPFSAINTANPGSFVEVNNFVTETVAPSVLAVTGNDAIVDWVWLELRDMADSDVVVATRSALVQRDGDIVDLDGTSMVEFPDSYVGDYYLLVRHRNHLGAMTADPVDFTAVMPIDFTVAAQPTFGTTATSARRLVKTGIYGLWAGNALPFAGGFNVKYNGSSNDRLPILNAVGSPLGILSGVYRLEDLNMDGQVKYNGSRNDRVIILQNVGPGTPLNIITQEPNN